jgi:hypothetical protein
VNHAEDLTRRVIHGYFERLKFMIVTENLPPIRDHEKAKETRRRWAQLQCVGNDSEFTAEHRFDSGSGLTIVGLGA